MFTRRLGRSEIEVSALGMGTAPIGGQRWDRQWRQDKPMGYGRVDDAESLRALERALALGITFEGEWGRKPDLTGRPSVFRQTLTDRSSQS